MKSFSEFLNEHIIVGDNHSDVMYAFSGPNQKYLMMVPESVSGRSSYLLAQFQATPQLIAKIKHTILSTNVGDDPSRLLTYDQKETVRKNIQSIGLHAGDWKLNDLPGIPMTSEVVSILQDEFNRKATDPQALFGSIGTSVLYGHATTRAPEPRTLQALVDHMDLIKPDKFSCLVYFTGGNYVRIDNKARKISIADRSAENNNRMGTYDGGKKQYVLPLSDYSIHSEPQLVKYISSLVTKFPYMKDYHLEDSLIPIPVEYKVSDVLNGIGRIAQQALSFDSRFKNAGTMTVYHGTSTSLYKVIEKQGLRPGYGPEYGDKISGHSDFLVYFSFALPEVRKYAVRAGQGMGSTVLQVTLRDFTKIVFDEDNLHGAFGRIPENIMQELKVRLLQLFPSREVLQFSDQKGLTIAENPLSPWGVKAIFATPNLTQSQKNVLNIIGYYALKGSNTITFGYRGVIPPRDIKVVEQFKSTATKDVDDKYEEKYGKVMTTFKSFHGNSK